MELISKRFGGDNLSELLCELCPLVLHHSRALRRSELLWEVLVEELKGGR